MKSIFLYVMCVLFNITDQCDVSNTHNVSTSDQTEIRVEYNDKQQSLFINGFKYVLLPSYTYEKNIYTFYTKTTVSIEIDMQIMQVRVVDIECFDNNKPKYSIKKYKINHIRSSF